MNISHNKLYRLIVEEYLLEEALTAGDPEVEDLLKRIMGDKYRPPEERDPVRYAKHGGDTEPMEKPHATEPEKDVPVPDETFILDEPAAPERSAMSAEELSTTIGELIHGRDPEEVSEIFQLAFEKLPGVELSSPGDPDYPGEETLYVPGAEGRPAAGFRLEELMLLIKEVMAEGHYFDMGGPEEIYNILDPEGLVQKSDAELVDMIRAAGAEKIIVLDGEGDLANREEVIAALKDV